VSRLDAFLKNAGLFKSRAQARRACDEGRVRIEGAAAEGAGAKGAHAVRVGERLEIETGSHRLEIEVLQVPDRPVARDRRGQFVRQLRREPLPAAVLSFDDEP
jgi:ribosomal 50S subunit-recycling heat shock protein